ncbi:MAG: hypothetical protein ACON3Z_02275 [Bradymonadia bacterium]
MRRAFTYFHYALCLAFVVIVAYSATVGAFSAPLASMEAGPTAVELSNADGQKCVRDFDALHTRLHTHAQLQFNRTHSKDALRLWTEWSNEWRQSLDRLRAYCKLKSAPTMKPVSAYAKSIERLQMAYDNALRAYFNHGHKAAKRVEQLKTNLGL